VRTLPPLYPTNPTNCSFSCPTNPITSPNTTHREQRKRDAEIESDSTDSYDGSIEEAPDEDENIVYGNEEEEEYSDDNGAGGEHVAEEDSAGAKHEDDTHAETMQPEPTG
jgi:hypothetical protein